MTNTQHAYAAVAESLAATFQQTMGLPNNPTAELMRDALFEAIALAHALSARPPGGVVAHLLGAPH